MDTTRYTTLTLVDRANFSDDLAVFTMEADEPVGFEPGQYATLGILEDGQNRPLLRPYSIASPPHSSELEFFVERVDEGKLTPKLWDLDLGTEVWMRKKIVGRFVLDTSRRYHVMAATVTGVAPYASIAFHQQRRLESGDLDEPHHLLVVHGASRSWELGFYVDRFEALAAEVDWLHYVPTVSRPWEDPDWTGECGRVEDVLRKYMDAASGFSADSAATYACGHPQMIDKAEGIFERAGVPEEAIHEEKYFVERVTA